MKFHLLFLQDIVYHFLRFLDYIVLYGIMVKHPEVCGINGYLYFVDEFLIIQVDGLHSPGIHLVGKKQMGFSDCLALQVSEKSFVTRPLADQINQDHAQQENSSRHPGIL